MNAKVMDKIGYGLYVLTAKENDKDNGCIINTVQQVTSTPNRISITVCKDNYTHDMIMRTKEFNVSIISEKADFELFKHFGFQSGRDVDKLSDYVEKQEASNGIMFITNGTNSYISGKVIDTVDLGTHTLFVADVTDGEVLNDTPSATYDYYHKNIKVMPKKSGETKQFVCTICGYIYEGDELPADFVCPLCNHGVEDFEELK